MKVSIIIPTLNEEKNLSHVLKEIPKEIDEVIIVDGNSKDKTVEIAKQYNAKVIYDSIGKGSALRKGMAEAKGDIIITMDADYSNRINEISFLIDGIKAGYDICMGSRFLTGGGTEDMPLIRRFGNKMFVMMVNIIWHKHYSDLCYGYRSFRKDIIPKLKLESDGFGIETEISIRAAKIKAKVIEFPSFEKPRLHGNGNLRTFPDGWQILKRIFREIFKK